MADIANMLIQLRTELANTRIKEQQLLTAITELERLSGQGESFVEVDPTGSKPFSNVTYGDAAYQLIGNHGPLGTRELADMLLRGGARTKARNFVSTLYTSLHKDGRFRLSDCRWHLRSDGVPLELSGGDGNSLSATL